MLTPAQSLVLHALAAADPTASAFMAMGNDTELAAWLNEPTTHIVWRSVLTPKQARAAIVQAATQLDALTVGKRDALLWLASGDLDVSNAAVRAAIDDLCGSQATLKSALQDAQRRACNRAEKALATGTGTSAVPALLGWEGNISINDVSLVRSAE